MLNKQSLSVEVEQTLNNQQGDIAGDASLSLRAAQLDNRQGTISSQNGSIHAEHLDNRAEGRNGSLILGQTLAIAAKQIDNQGTKATGEQPTQGIQAHSLTIKTERLNNQQGGVYSGNQLVIQAAERVDNQQGELISTHQLSLDHGGALMLNNQDGLIAAGNRISLNAKGLEHEGSIKTQGDLNVKLKDSFSLNHAFQVANNLTFSTEGDFINHSELVVGNSASLSARHIHNHENAEISAAITEIHSQSLTNEGLIDCTQNTIKTGSLTNIGTGRIYGDYLAIQADELYNLKQGNQSATIAARKRLDLGVGTLVNRDNSLILSLGETYIGRSIDPNNTEKSQVIRNESATIELLGNAQIDAKEIINTDTNVNITTRTETEHFDLYGKENSSGQIENWYHNGVDGKIDHANGQRRKSATFEFFDKTKGKISTSEREFWQRKAFTRTTIIPESENHAPAKFLIGKNLFLNSDYTLNQYSRFLIGDKLYLNHQEIHDEQDIINAENSRFINEDLKSKLVMNDVGRFYRYEQTRRKPEGRSGKFKKTRFYLDERIANALDETTEKTVGFNLVLNTIGKPITEGSNTVIDTQPTLGEKSASAMARLIPSTRQKSRTKNSRSSPHRRLMRRIKTELSIPDRLSPSSIPPWITTI